MESEFSAENNWDVKNPVVLRSPEIDQLRSCSFSCSPLKTIQGGVNLASPW